MYRNKCVFQDFKINCLEKTMSKSAYKFATQLHSTVIYLVNLIFEYTKDRVVEGFKNRVNQLKKLWKTCFRCGPGAVALLGFPLALFGTWAAIMSVKVSWWTQWKDSLQWCESVSRTTIFSQDMMLIIGDA